MFFFGVLIVALLLVIPESRALIDTFVSQSEQSIEANLQVFGVAFVCAVGATVISWLASLLKRDREPGEYYRVVRVESRGRG